MPTRSIHILAMCLTLSVVLTAGPATAQDLTMGNVNPPRHGTSLASQQFIDKLAELSGGKIKLGERIPGGYVFVDGQSIGEVDYDIMRERGKLAAANLQSI